MYRKYQPRLKNGNHIQTYADQWASNNIPPHLPPPSYRLRHHLLQTVLFWSSSHRQLDILACAHHYVYQAGLPTLPPIAKLSQAQALASAEIGFNFTFPLPTNPPPVTTTLDFAWKTTWQKNNLTGRRRDRKTTWQEDDLTGRRTYRKTNWQKENLTGRQLDRKLTWQEDDLTGRRPDG